MLLTPGITGNLQTVFGCENLVVGGECILVSSGQKQETLLISYSALGNSFLSNKELSGLKYPENLCSRANLAPLLRCNPSEDSV